MIFNLLAYLITTGVIKYETIAERKRGKATKLIIFSIFYLQLQFYTEPTKKIILNVAISERIDIKTVEKAKVFLIYCPSKFIAINEFKKEIIKAIIDGRII